jgi:cell division protein FtsN
VFVGLAIVAVVALGGLAIFVAGQMDRDGGQPEVSAGRVVEQESPVAPEDGPAGETTTGPGIADEGAGAQEHAAAVEDDAGAGTVAAGEPDRPAGAVEDDEPITGEPVATESAAAGPTGPGDAGAGTPQPAEEPAEEAVEEPVEEPATEAAPALDMTAFRKPVGQEGWALWLYSFPDAESADVEVRRLERRGLRAQARAVELKDRGRWFRVYTGSFASRAAARDAVAPLKAELNHDWVIPARF